MSRSELPPSERKRVSMANLRIAAIERERTFHRPLDATSNRSQVKRARRSSAGGAVS